MATVNEKMTAIADNIREKTGGTEELSLDEMASGVNEVYEAGKQAEYDRFWDNYVGYNSAADLFAGSGWNENNFYPNFEFTIGQRTFYRHNWFNKKASPYDLAKRFEDLGLFKNGLKLSDGRDTFAYSHFTRLPKIDASSLTSACSGTFYDMKFLVTFDEFIVGEHIPNFGTAFYNCSALKNIIISGVIPVSISFSFSPLTVASLKSIITHLKDYSGTESENTYTVTFKASAFAALEAEGSTSPNGNTWTEYIDDLKWNLELA